MQRVREEMSLDGDKNHPQKGGIWKREEKRGGEI